MQTGRFYFIKDEYYQKFSNCGLLNNKDGRHKRPCYYCFRSEGFYWMIPISSRVEKYEEIYQNKLIRYPNYDGIRFGYVNGQRRAFLIQNMCPVSQKYIDEEYRIEHNTVPVRINDALSAELNAIARKVIRLYKRGIRITLVDIGYILNILEQES